MNKPDAIFLIVITVLFGIPILGFMAVLAVALFRIWWDMMLAACRGELF